MSDLSVNIDDLLSCPVAPDWDRERLELLRQNTLTWVNQIRAKFDMPALITLARGEPGQALGCVIVNCFKPLSARVDTRYTVVNTRLQGSIRFSNPEHVQWFIAYFDAGLYRELESAA